MHCRFPSDSLPAKHSKEIYLGMTERCFLAHPFENNYVGMYRASKQHNCDFVVTRVLTKYRAVRINSAAHDFKHHYPLH